MLYQALKNMEQSWYSVYRKKNRTVGKRGTPMMFIGYAKNHARNCYHMFNPNTGYITETRNIICTTASQIALPFEPDDGEERL